MCAAYAIAVIFIFNRYYQLFFALFSCLQENSHLFVNIGALHVYVNSKGYYGSDEPDGGGL